MRIRKNNYIERIKILNTPLKKGAIRVHFRKINEYN
nr:MAG TPA: hypothetical protein [Caudoviricetes sp.]